MRHFTNVKDLGNLNEAVQEALEIKKNRYAYKHLGENKTLMMVFFNSSLRTRLSTQKARHEPRYEHHGARYQPRCLEA